MNDYKELIEHPELCWDYIDRLRIAIEQLVKERDAAIKCIEGIETLLDYGYEYEIREEIKHWRGVQE